MKKFFLFALILSLLSTVNGLAADIPATGTNDLKESSTNTLADAEFECVTTGTVTNGKYHFASEKFQYSGECNRIRFTLTESGAFYKNGAKRLSFDSFALYDSEGNAVELSADNFTGNNGKGYANMLDGTNGTYTNGSWNNSNAEDDWFEITIGKELGGAFSFSFVTENTTMNAKAFSIKLSYEEEAYTLNINAPEGMNPAISYNGETLTNGSTIEGTPDASLFNIEEIEGYEWSIEIDNETKSVTVTFVKKYTLHIEAPEGETVVVTYDGTTVSDYLPNGFDTWLIDATDIEGYKWEVTVNREERSVTIVYTQLADTVNPAAAVALADRIGGAGTAGNFKFVLSPSYAGENGEEKFLIGSEDDKILIKGTTISAITTGLGWYLNYYAKINIAWNSLNEKGEGEAYADLTGLPMPEGTEEHTCDAKYRYFLNYCTFGYSMTSWTWKRWQQEIDWMALHGINMPLQIVGLEEVWRKFLTMDDGNGNRKYNYTDKEAKAFVAGPAFTAWWGMNNLEGWGGTEPGTLNGGTWEGAGGVQDDAWYRRQEKLAKQIVNRQRELGMQPVLPGFSGMVPTNFTGKTGVATDANGGKWAGGFQRPRIIDPTDSRFADIAADYYSCLNDVMGESRYYSMDPFHEGGAISSGKYTEAYRAIYDAMYSTNANSQWVIQQWQWNNSQKLSLNAVPAGRLIVLDLFSDGSPAFTRYNGYAPQDAIYCAIPNFGGRSGLMGRLNNLTNNYFTFKSQYASIKGIGAAPEAIEQTPVTYDLLFQLPWMGTKPDMAEWISQYAAARYGIENPKVNAAWELLRQGPLNYGADAIQGPVEDVWAARPNLKASKASAWGKTLNDAAAVYTKARRQMLIDATYKLLGQNNNLNLTAGSIYESNYNYDIVEFGGAVMADYAYELLLGIGNAKDAAGDGYNEDATFIARRDAFLSLIADMDEFKGTNLNFRLGKWTQEARDAAAEVEGATTATPDWYEFNNARTIITTWSSPNTNLNDYSYRSWQGLLKDFYLPRWQYYFENGCASNIQYGFFEWNWAHGMKHEVGQTAVSTTRLQEGETGYSYRREPEGNTVEVANRIFGKYIIPIANSNGNSYAYRYIDNDFTSVVTIIAAAGETVDLADYFGNLENVTVSGDFLSGEVTGTIITVSTTADGAYTGKISITDGTAITFTVVVNPAFNGAYNINYNGKPVFIGYNSDGDNNGNIGYKLIDPNGIYASQAAAGDAVAIITPKSTGYAISMQGMYMRAPNYSAWNHILFSESGGDSGIYLFEESAAGEYKIYSPSSVNNPINYVNDYGNVFGNDRSSKPGLSAFTITPAETYLLSVPAGGATTLCLPFNVILPEGVTASNITNEGIVSDEEGGYSYVLEEIAKVGETLKGGVPAIIKAEEGTYNLAITMEDAGAKEAPNSVLKGNFTAKRLEQGITKRYMLGITEGKPVFKPFEGAADIAANSCWLESNYDAVEIKETVSGETTGIDDVIVESGNAKGIFDLQGRKLTEITKPGVYVIGGKKTIVN